MSSLCHEGRVSDLQPHMWLHKWDTRPACVCAWGTYPVRVQAQHMYMQVTSGTDACVLQLAHQQPGTIRLIRAPDTTQETPW